VFDLEGPFDAVMEHTCFCAIDVSRRAEYVDTVFHALRPGGVLFGLFYAHGKEGGPPFDTSEAEIHELFAPHFHLQRLQRAPDSFEARAGKELEFVFRVLGDSR
jgi:methyl halide transferase